MYEDYVDFDRAFIKELNVYLERLARNLRGRSAVVVPFAGDVEETRADVLSKDWTSAEYVAGTAQSHQSLYHIARQVTTDRPDLGLVFSLQPNVFGFSIDLIKAGSYLRELIQDRRRPVGRRVRAWQSQSAQQACPALCRQYVIRVGAVAPERSCL